MTIPTPITMTATDEKVLVVPTSAVRAFGWQFFEHGGFHPAATVMKGITRMSRFVSRQEVEENESYLQLIPYGITIRRNPRIIMAQQQILTYQRPPKGGEKRLQNLYSIGIGGHINPIDHVTISGQKSIYTTALRRECSEELIDWTTSTKWLLQGILYDPSTPVGRVHLGLICWRRIPYSQIECIKPREQAARYLEWRTLPNLRTLDNVENWTKLLVEHCFEMGFQQTIYF